MLAALAVCRFVHYSAAMFFFGAGIFVWMLAPETLAARWENPFWRCGHAAALLVATTAIAWLALGAGTMGDGWPDMLRADTIVAVLADTEFGHSWLLHGSCILVLLAVSAARRSRLTCLASSLVLASVGLIGHAAMRSGVLGWLDRGNLGLHLLFAGFWLGGLVPLLPTVRLVRDPEFRVAAIIALRRFSNVGHAAVAAVILTGVANAVFILGIDVRTEMSVYRLLLLSKIAVVAAMVSLALANRYWVVPRLRSSPDAAQALVRNTVIEIGLGATAIALVSLFGLLDPHG